MMKGTIEPMGVDGVASKLRFYHWPLPVRVLILFWLLVSPPTLAQQVPTKKPPAQIRAAPDDRGPITVRQPNPARLNEFRNNREYRYDRDTGPPDNPMGRFLDWFWRKVQAFFSSRAYRYFWQYVILAVIAGVVIYLLARAKVLGFLFPDKATDAPLDYDTLIENIHAINFGEAIDAAVVGRNFRLAVRLQYLQLLKHLTDQGQIDWKPDKTNRQYTDEINHPLFSELTTRFEYVWYGDFSVSEAQYGQLADQFRTFQASSRLTTQPA